MLVDSHCHLDFPDFAAERDAMIARARAVGVATLLTIGTRLDQFAGVRAIAEAYDDVWCSVGAHPHEASDHAAMTAGDLVTLAEHGRVFALDLYGFGRTSRDGHRSRMTDQRALVSRFIEEVAGGGPVVLVGNSMGGGISMLQAAFAPASISTSWSRNLRPCSAMPRCSSPMRSNPPDSSGREFLRSAYIRSSFGWCTTSG